MNQSSYESLRENGNENYTKELGHMTNMAAMPIYGKNHKKIFSSRTNRPMILKLGM